MVSIPKVRQARWNRSNTDTAETKVSYVAATPKPRLVKLSIVPQGEDKFSVVGHPYKSTIFVLKVELGGLTGVIAPVIGNGWQSGISSPVRLAAMMPARRATSSTSPLAS